MTDKITDEGAVALMNAVVVQAVNDYKKALYKYNTVKGRGRKTEYRNIIGECELFFRKNIDAYCTLDGEQIIRRVRKMVQEDLKTMGIIMEVPG